MNWIFIRVYIVGKKKGKGKKGWIVGQGDGGENQDFYHTDVSVRTGPHVLQARVFHVCNHSAGEVETGAVLGLAGRSV